MKKTKKKTAKKAAKKATRRKAATKRTRTAGARSGGTTRSSRAKLKMTEQSVTGAGSLEQVRDLLFGNHIREVDRRIAEIEKAMQQSLQRTRDEMNTRMATLESFAKAQIKAMGDAMKAESKGASAAAAQLEKMISGQLSDLEAQSAAGLIELKREVEALEKTRAKELRAAVTEMRGELTAEARAVREDSVDRAALAKLFTDFAGKLNGGRKGRS